MREAFELFLVTGCLYKTRDSLNVRGHKTRGDRRWSVPELRRVLRRDTYREEVKRGIRYSLTCRLASLSKLGQNQSAG